MTPTLAMPLTVALLRIADQFDLSRAALIDFAAQDPHGGYHADYDDGFPSGSLWRVEGQFLYALIRALKPQKVLELGTWHGASATHILQALKDNGGGGLDYVDNRAYGDIVIGGMIPKDLLVYSMPHATSLEKEIEDGIWYKRKYDFIFEDAMHTAEQVEFVWKHADALLNPGGVIVSHDAMHAVAGEAVREGIRRAGYETTNVLIAPADCGFAVWRKSL